MTRKDDPVRQRWRRAWRMIRLAGWGISDYQLCETCKETAKSAERAFAARLGRRSYAGLYQADLAICLRAEGALRVWRVGDRLMMHDEEHHAFALSF